MAPKCSSDLTFLVPETVASGQELYDELPIFKEGYKDTFDKVGLSINFDDRVDNKQRSPVKRYYIMDGMSKMFPYPYDLGTLESASAIVTIIIRHTALNQNVRPELPSYTTIRHSLIVGPPFGAVVQSHTKPRTETAEGDSG